MNISQQMQIKIKVKFFLVYMHRTAPHCTAHRTAHHMNYI